MRIACNSLEACRNSESWGIHVHHRRTNYNNDSNRRKLAHIEHPRAFVRIEFWVSIG